MSFLLVTTTFLAGILTQSGDPVSAIIQVSNGQTCASGFRDIPIGFFFYQITLQSTGEGLYYSYFGSSSGETTWVPQDVSQGASTHTHVTTGAFTEAIIGYQYGSAYFMSDYYGGGAGGAHIYTTNACFSDTYADDANSGSPPAYEAGTGMRTCVDSLPSTMPADSSIGWDLPLFSFSGTGAGSLWFTADSGSVAVYWLDQNAGQWTKLSDPTHFADTQSISSGQYRLVADFTFSGQTNVYIRYLSDDSVNPGSDGDTFDPLVVGNLGELNDDSVP